MTKYRVHLERRITRGGTSEIQTTTVDIEAETAIDARNAATHMDTPIEWPACGDYSGVTYPIAVSAEPVDPFGDAIRHAIRRPNFSAGRW